MTNLLTETRGVLWSHGYIELDITFIGSHYTKEETTLNEFILMAGSLDYDSGYGTVEIRSDLTITLKDGSYFRRWDYDGSEGWKHIPRPDEHGVYTPLMSLGIIQ